MGKRDRNEESMEVDEVDGMAVDDPDEALNLLSNADLESKAEDTIDVDFGFFDPRSQDFHSIKRYLINYLEGQEWNSGELADIVADQVQAGSIIRVDEDDDVFGFTSVVNLHKYKDLECVKSIKKYMLKKVKNAQLKSELQELFSNESKRLGLILNERLMNVPPVLGFHLQKALAEDMKWACENQEDPKEVRDTFRFDNYIIMTSVCRERNTGDVEGSTKKTKNKSAVEEDVYIKVEDQIYRKNADFEVTYGAENSDNQAISIGDGTLGTYRQLMVLSKGKFKAAIAEMSHIAP